MSMQVTPIDAGLSATAHSREAYLTRLLDLAKQEPVTLEWLQELRDRAAVRVGEQTFPSNRDEEWRFTDLSPVLQINFEAVSAHHSAVNIDGIAEFALPEAENSRLVFVNGVYAPEFSAIADLPEGLLVSNLSGLADSQAIRPYLGQQSGAEEVFTALNTAGLTDAAVVFVPRNQVVETPLHLLFISTTRIPPVFTQPRCLIVAEPNSSVTLVEEYAAIGGGVYFTNAVTEIWLQENAQVSHTRIQRESQAAFHIGKTAVSQARDARYTSNAISLGAKLSRHHLEIYQTGEQTQTILNGLTMIHGEQLSDTHSAIALTKPYGTSRQLHKCIIDDRAHGVFNGKVFVPKAAQFTDAGQLNQNLLLSAKARMDTKPQLEIVADNVKCSHGATVGQLEADEVFYLQSRGIDSDSARKLLIYAFAHEILEQIPVESLQQTLSQSVTPPL